MQNLLQQADSVQFVPFSMLSVPSFGLIAMCICCFKAYVQFSNELNFHFLIEYLKTTDHGVTGSIPGTSTNFKCGLGLERGPPSLVRTIG